ncbi:MAG: hypothetical protein ACHQ9S_14470 [Candidatus Binatia bacterium]
MAEEDTRAAVGLPVATAIREAVEDAGGPGVRVEGGQVLVVLSYDTEVSQ